MPLNSGLLSGLRLNSVILLHSPLAKKTYSFLQSTCGQEEPRKINTIQHLPLVIRSLNKNVHTGADLWPPRALCRNFIAFLWNEHKCVFNSFLEPREPRGSGKGSLGLVREEFMWHHMELEGEDGLIIFNYVPLELLWGFWTRSLLWPPLSLCHSRFFTGGSAHATMSIKKFITASFVLTSCGARESCTGYSLLGLWSFGSL